MIDRILNQYFAGLDEKLGEEGKEILLGLEHTAFWKLHMGLGLCIRKDLRRNLPLKAVLRLAHLYEPDESAVFLIRLYLLHCKKEVLNGIIEEGKQGEEKI